MGLTRTLRVLVAAISLIAGTVVPGAAAPVSVMALPGHPAITTITLDAVSIRVQSSLMRNLTFTTSHPGDASQVATATARSPYRELAIVAIPFGTQPSPEGLPAARRGAAPSYARALARYRQSQGGHPVPAPAVNLFGSRVAGSISTSSIQLDATHPPRAVSIAEWTVEAGPRLWIVRASQELIGGETQQSAAHALVDLDLSSGGLRNRTTVDVSSPTRRAAPANADPPSWWRGTCNVNNHPGSFALGAVFRGMPACGPRPVAGGRDVLVRFYPGAWGEFEWECVELTMRYLYVTYGRAPYPANGKDVVANYPGTRLMKVNNGTAGRGPAPGDVLSYGATTAFGHSSVVSAASINASGNGSITVIEENNSRRGATTMTVSRWTVQGSPYAVIGWLHPR